MDLEWVMLANHAEDVNGLLYLNGGGWDTVTVNQPLAGGPPGAVAVMNGTVVVRLLFQTATETDRSHGFTVTIVDEDGGTIGTIGGDVDVPRIQGIPPGWHQNVNLIMNLHGMPLPKFGLYTIFIQVDGNHLGDKSFRVVKGFD